MSAGAAAALDRELVAAVADVILPRSATMPSAGDVDVSGTLLDRVLRADPPLGPRLAEALSVLPAPTDAGLRELRDRHPARFTTLMLVVTAAYYLSPIVRDRIGYDGQQAMKIDVHELPWYLEDGALERVMARGPLYRDAEGSQPD